MKHCNIHGEAEFILVDYLLIRYECSKCLMSKTVSIEEKEKETGKIIKVDFKNKVWED